MRLKTTLFVLSILLAALFQVPSSHSQGSQSTIPTPADVLGFTPGDDRKLASWDQVIDYFKRLDQASDRVVFEELGKSTMGKPFVVATISSPANLARLDEFKTIQEQLADPRKLGEPSVRDRKAAELIAKGKTIVLITCGIHSTEVGSYLSSMLIAHRLASSDDAEIKNILDNTIVLLVPSLNPDGVDIVKNWYDKTLGTPYEGTDPPELYHKYTGHDDNRDWYAFTQVETQITVDKIHNVWHPQIVHDIHQQGSFGSRLFLPPYMKPVEPNVPKQIVDGYTELGYYLAKQMRAKGFQGVTTDSTYDAWSPSRAYSHYHGGVRILSETASARIASPITVKFDDLTSREGYDPRKETANFGPLWQGGEWKLRDITNTMTTCAFFLLKHAAENREQWLKRFYAIGRDAVRARKTGELQALIVPPTQNSSRLIQILERGGVEVRYPKPFAINGKSYSLGTAVVAIPQPYVAFAEAVLKPRLYPDQRDANGHPIAPYDVTAHALPLLMNVPVNEVYKPLKLIDAGLPATGTNGGCGDANPPRRALYRSSVPTMDEGWTRWTLENQSRCLDYQSLNDQQIRQGDLNKVFDTIVVPDQPPRTIVNGYRTGAMPPELTGGLGSEGIKALRKFVEDGGTLVCLNRASDFVIEQFKLPLRNVVAGLARAQYYVPGSILRLELDTTHPIAKGMPKESIAWAEDSPVFEVTHDSNSSVPATNVKIIGWYPRDKDPLLSGWLLGGERIKGKAALVEVTMGKGRIILFGFRPQYRAQSLATYPLFFNSLSAR
jgi:murein tripeptide amidase MpaA